jgi:hypothetical protein
MGAIAAIGNGLYVRTRPQGEARRTRREYLAQPKRDARGKFAAKAVPASSETARPEVFGRSEQLKSAEDAARLTKANALLILLLRAKLTVELAALMTEAEWRQVAQAAGVRVPSPETRETVLAMMRAIETPLTGAIQ